MPIYRYSFQGVSLPSLNLLLPSPATVSAVGSIIYVDLDELATAKADLDDVMVALGFLYVGEAPVTTPAEAAAAGIPAVNLSSGATGAGVVLVTNGAGAFSYQSPVGLSDTAAVEVDDTTSAAGVGTKASRDDHVHAHGDRAGGTLHALATDAVAGFMSPADKDKLDDLSTIKEWFWAGTDYGNDAFSVWRVRTVNANGSFNFSFAVPLDFVSLVSLVLVGIIDGPAVPSPPNKNIDLFSNYAAAGEFFNAHSESDTTTTYVLPANQTLYELDVAGVFSAIAPGDYCALQVDHNQVGGNIDYIGVKMRYDTA